MPSEPRCRHRRHLAEEVAEAKEETVGSVVAKVRAAATAEEAVRVEKEATEVDSAVVTEAEEGTAADWAEEAPGRSGYV